MALCFAEQAAVGRDSGDRNSEATEFLGKAGRALVLDCMNAKRRRSGSVLRAVVDENDFIGIALEDVECDLIDFWVGLAQAEVAGTEERVHEIGEAERRETILIE